MAGPPHGHADHFSAVAASYAKFRPAYPPDLFRWLADAAPGHRQAWDCGTGSGQAAIGLADHFIRVQATDASAAQLAEARPHPRVTYLEAWAGQSGLEAGSVDLACAAQAAHWFDLTAYYHEVRRTGRPGGLVALWCYGLSRITPAVDRLVDAFAHERVGAWWPPGREHVDAAYATLPFPFTRIATPAFTIEAQLDRNAFLSYVRTWSAVERCQRAEARDPVMELERQLGADWPAAEPRLVRWPLAILAGRLPGH